MALALGDLKSDVSQWVYERFRAMFPSATLTFENAPFDPVAGSQWARLSVFVDAVDPSELSPGPGGWRAFGTLILQLFQPYRQGTYPTDRMAWELLRTLRLGTGPTGVSFHGLGGAAARVETVGADGPWYQQNLVVPFYANGGL